MIAPFHTARLVMLPLRIEYAGEMANVLSDPGLYTFTGGEPPTVEALEVRYRRQLAGPGRPGEEWLNWVVRHEDELIGFVQATVIAGTAEIAWVIGTRWQGHGYAKEAAVGLVGWLNNQQVIAHVHADHTASAAVAAAAGLTRTDQLDDGEYLWSKKNRPG